jgi:hypothetical protein
MNMHHELSRERSMASAIAAMLLVAPAGCSDLALGAPAPGADAATPPLAAPAARWELGSQGGLPGAPAGRGAQPEAVAPEGDERLREARRLAEIKAVFARSPEAPLSLLDAHRVEFPEGRLAAEREITAIDALMRRGSAGEARARAQTFLASFPSSPHAERVRRVAASGS